MPCRLLPILLLFLLCFEEVQAQLQYGLTAGGNVGVVIGPLRENSSAQPVFAPSLGIAAYKALNNRFAIQLEAKYCLTGVHFQQQIYDRDTLWTEQIGGLEYQIPATYSADVRGQIKLNYIDFPAQLIFHFNERFSTGLGPRFAVLFKGKFEGTGDVIIGEEYVFAETTEDFDESENLHLFDFGLTGSWQYKFSKQLQAQFAFSGGLIALNEKGDLIQDRFFNGFANLSVLYFLGSTK